MKNLVKNLQKKKKYFSSLMGLSLLINFLLYILISMIGIWFNTRGVWDLGAIIGYGGVIFGGLYFLYVLIRRTIIKRRKANVTYEEPTPNILAEFIKAKYNKYCPKIEWNK